MLFAVTMCDEAQAYICFCAIMKRLSTNFMLDGIAMTQKFAHLSEALQYYDPEFFEYLKLQQADDLLFCYRWLLLEMKREFAFEDSLRMLEVLWSSLPSEPPVGELNLFEKEFVPPSIEQSSPKTTSTDVVMRKRDSAYTNLCALRRQSSSQSLLPTSPSTLITTDPNTAAMKLDGTKRFNHSLDENITRAAQDGNTRNISKSYQSLDESKLRQSHQKTVTHSIDTGDASQVNNFEVKNNEKNQQASPISPNNNDQVDSIPHQSQITHTKQEEQSTANNNIRPVSEGSTAGSGHFKGLKERIAAGKKEIFASLDKIEKFPFDNKSSDDSEQTEPIPKSGKIVKNFNEFLNFASKGAKLTLNRSASVNSNESRKMRASLRMTKSTHQNLNSNKGSDSENLNRTDGEPYYEGGINKKALQLQLEDKKQSSFDGSSPDDSEYFPMTTSITRELRLELDNLNRQVFGNSFSPKINANGFDVAECNSPSSAGSHLSNNRSPANFSSEISYKKFNQNSEEDTQLDKIYKMPNDKNTIEIDSSKDGLGVADLSNAKRASINAEVFIWENPLHQLSPTATTTTNQEPSTSINSQYLAESKNPFYSKDFLQTLTPDEQNDLEYDGEMIDEVTGKKSITPIRLVRKKDDESSKVRSGHSSKRNSNIFRNDSETDSETSEQVMNDLMKTSMLSETNPFLMDMAASLEASANSAQNIEDPNPIDNRDVFIDEEASEAETETNVVLETVKTSLPPPKEFGGGNPFLMFLCLSLLLQHRNFVMKNNMDYNEMAMHFDKMVRKHNVVRVLNQARRMYADYTKSQNLQLANAPSTNPSSYQTDTNRQHV